MTRTTPDLLPGTLDMLVLKVLAVGPMHGYGLAQQLALQSDEVFRVEEGSLYPALARMRQKGWITAEWRRTPNNQRARYYSISAAGRKELGAKKAEFAEVLRGIARIMGTA